LAKARKNTKKKSPSRIKYETSHPTVSARIPIEIKEKVIANLKTLDMNMADAFKKLAGELEEKAKPIDLMKKAEYKAGYRAAKNYYAVPYQCSKCGQITVINTPEEKEAASILMTAEGWRHETCPEPNVPQTTPAKPIPATRSWPNPNPLVLPVAHANGSQDKIRRFLKEQAAPQQMLKSDSNKKNHTGN
jgi:mRNA-degrading endonuclease RelE of RelBE toxin-antitoxin system